MLRVLLFSSGTQRKSLLVVVFFSFFLLLILLFCSPHFSNFPSFRLLLFLSVFWLFLFLLSSSRYFCSSYYPSRSLYLSVVSSPRRTMHVDRNTGARISSLPAAVAFYLLHFLLCLLEGSPYRIFLLCSLPNGDCISFSFSSERFLGLSSTPVNSGTKQIVRRPRARASPLCAGNGIRG